MPSPTGVTRLVRKKKKTLIGKRRKREERQAGSVNYFKAFKEAPAEVKTILTPKLKKFGT